MKDILIIANFCRDFSENDNGRFVYLCKELSKNHNVEIVTSSFAHATKTHRAPLTVDWPFKITFLREPGYKKNISVKRFYSHYVWGRNLRKYLKQRKKPDVVYCAVPSLTGPLSAAKYCQKNDIRFIIDIQDIWPEAFQMVFNIPVVSSLIFAPFKRLVNGIYKRADEIVAVSNTYVNRALSVNSKCKSGLTVYLGTKLDTFDQNVKNNPVEKKDDELWLGYCGTLGASYDIICVLDALAMVKEHGITPPKFIIMGDGARRAEFEEYAKKKNVDAVFTGRMPYDEMCGRLCACDIVINPICKGSAGSVINKVGDYAMSGRPVINTQENQEYRELLEKNKAGINCECENAEEVASAIETLIKDSDMRCKLAENSRKLGETEFDRAISYQRIIDKILEA